MVLIQILVPGKLFRVGIKTLAVVHGNTSQRLLPVMCTSVLISRSNVKVLDFHSGPNTNCTGFKTRLYIVFSETSAFHQIYASATVENVK